MKFTLITGATGLLGCFVLQQGLRAGLPLAALVRGDQARERLEILLSQFPEGERQALPPDFPVLKGDIGEAGLALSESDANWIGLHCDAVLNCAGVVKFQAEAGGEPYRTNFDGTRHLLAFCKQAKIPHFHQVSTAYVCGQRAGTVLESELDAGQMFHNDYERSKYMAEILVRESTGFESVSIYRPSVVLGDALTGFTPTFQGAYSLLWAGWAVAQEGLQRDQFLASLGLDEQDCINLVTADWVAKAMLELLQQKRSGRSTFHLTNPVPTPWAEFYDQLLGCLPAKPLDTKMDGTGQRTTLLEAYRPYFSNHPDFDSRTLQQDLSGFECPSLERGMLAGLCRYAVEQHFTTLTHQVTRHLQLLETIGGAEPPCLKLDLTGLHGGSWGIGRNSQITRWSDASWAVPTTAVCSTAILQLLVEAKLTVLQAIFSGLLLLEGEPQNFRVAEQRLQDLITRLVRNQ